MGHASFLLDELLHSVGPDDGSDQVALVGPGILLLHGLLSPAGMAELVWSYVTVNSIRIQFNRKLHTFITPNSDKLSALCKIY